MGEAFVSGFILFRLLSQTLRSISNWVCFRVLNRCHCESIGIMSELLSVGIVTLSAEHNGHAPVQQQSEESVDSCAEFLSVKSNVCGVECLPDTLCPKLLRKLPSPE
jgi:hypothetical protein